MLQAHVSSARSGASAWSSTLSHKQAANDQVSEGVRNFAVGFEVGLYVLPHGEGNVSVADPLG